MKKVAEFLVDSATFLRRMSALGKVASYAKLIAITVGSVRPRIGPLGYSTKDVENAFPFTRRTRQQRRPRRAIFICSSLPMDGMPPSPGIGSPKGSSKNKTAFPNSHAGYYPGAKMIGLKVIFRKSDGKLLGAQELGEACYAPQFGSAKDPVNFAGMIAGNILRGDMPVSHWGSVDSAFLLDVRSPVELVVENVPGAVNIFPTATSWAVGRTSLRS
jgi:hypothetical protein